jgi:hypothetical protein
METAATDVGDFESPRISEVAAACVMIELTVFSETGRADALPLSPDGG